MKVLIVVTVKVTDGGAPIGVTSQVVDVKDDTNLNEMENRLVNEEGFGHNIHIYSLPEAK